MEEIKLLGELLKTYGVSGLIIIIYVWEKHIKPRRKKANGEWVSYKELDAGMLDNKMRVMKLETTVANHLEREVQEDIMLAKMQTEQEHFKEEIKEFKDNQKAIFQMISEVKTILIGLHGRA